MRQTELLKRKLEILKRVSDLTRTAVLSGPQAAEHYLLLISRRRSLFAELRQIDRKLAKARPEADESRLRILIGAAARECLQAEAIARQSVPPIMADLQNHIRMIKNGKKLNEIYNLNYFSVGGGRDYRA
jgi:hypothetical protein